MLRNNFLTSHKFSNDSSPRESCMQSHIYTLLLYIIYKGRKHPYNARMNLLTESLLCILNSSDMFSFICLYRKTSGQSRHNKYIFRGNKTFVNFNIYLCKLNMPTHDRNLYSDTQRKQAMETLNTEQQFKNVMQECRSLFEKKLHDYNASWRMLRPSSLTDQLLIKAHRIRSIEVKGKALVEDSTRSEFVALINYGIVGLIQLEKGFADNVDITNEEALQLYDKYQKEALMLMLRKNHDYNEAWRMMRVSSYTDFILTKIERVKEIENLNGGTLVSEGIDANYMDIINYSVFGVIKLSENN